MKKKIFAAVILLLAVVVAAYSYRQGGEATVPPVMPTATSTAATSTPATSTSVVKPVPVKPLAPTPAYVGRPQFIAGPVSSLTSDGFVIRINAEKSRSIITDGNTLFRRYSADGSVLESMPASDVVPGMSVRVVGTSTPSGATWAAKVTTGKAAATTTAQTITL